MKKRDVLIVGAEGGSLTIEEQILEGKTFYAQVISETHFADNEEQTESISPLYHSFKQLMEHMKYDIFCLCPDYVDPSISKELLEIYMNYCDGKSPSDFNSERWDKALGVVESTYLVDELEVLGVSKDSAKLIYGIIREIKLSEAEVNEIEELLNDPMAFEGGGPSTRELLLLLIKDVQG